MDMNDRLSLDEATKLIAPRIKKTLDDDRTAEDRTRKRITRGIASGKLRRELDNTFVLGHLVDWARKTWPGKFNDMPAYVGMSIQGTFKCEGSASATVRVPTLEICHERLDAAQRRIDELEREVAELRPDAERMRNICQQNKDSARRKRRV